MRMRDILNAHVNGALQISSMAAMERPPPARSGRCLTYHPTTSPQPKPVVGADTAPIRYLIARPEVQAADPPHPAGDATATRASPPTSPQKTSPRDGLAGLQRDRPWGSQKPRTTGASARRSVQSAILDELFGCVRARRGADRRAERLSEPLGHSRFSFVRRRESPSYGGTLGGTIFLT